MANDKKTIQQELELEATVFFEAEKKPETGYLESYFEEHLKRSEEAILEGHEMLHHLKILYRHRDRYDCWASLNQCSLTLLEQSRHLPEPVRQFLFETLSGQLKEPKQTKTITQRRTMLALAAVMLEDRGLNLTSNEANRVPNICDAVANAWVKVNGDDDVTYDSIARAVADLGEELRDQLALFNDTPKRGIDL